ncbi:MAG: 3-hydroxybutyrate dehydrogenase [Alphaproteobacteria bacterium]|nr:3-hydroxybutyrate dehydrogenase [Alphaproteobacteria bacterium]
MRKTAIVTGSTSGIGEAIARGLAQAGCNVMLNGFGSPDKIETLRREIETSSLCEVAYSAADLTRPDEIEQMFEYATAKLGQVDVVVNNAGIQHVSPIESFPPAKWDQIIALNLSAAFHTTRLAFPEMKKAGWGRIINIASAHALVASPFKSAYVAAKHGLLGLTRASALEGAAFGVRVNAICPGYVKTSLVENQIADTAQARGLSEEAVIRDVILAAQPTRQFVRTEDIAALAVFLISDAAAQINGAALPIDGGWTAQ